MNKILCGHCAHLESDHKQGKTGVGCVKCYIREQNPNTRITAEGDYLHEWREFNRHGEHVREA